MHLWTNCRNKDVNKARVVKAKASKPRPNTRKTKAKAENAKVNFSVNAKVPGYSINNNCNKISK